MTSPTTEPVQLSNRPKRADALRNYEKLVAAGREAFTEADRSASLEDVARRAGVGIGTLYRHFPTRTDLVQAIYVDEVEAVARSAEELADLEPWDGLTAWLHNFLGYVATKQALAEELFAVDDPERQAVFAGCRNMLYGPGAPALPPGPPHHPRGRGGAAPAPRAGRGRRAARRDDRRRHPPRRRHRED